MNRRKMLGRLSLAPVAAAIAAARAPSAEGAPAKPKGRVLILVNNMSGLTARQVVEALDAGVTALNTDGCVPLEDCIRIVTVPVGAEVRDWEGAGQGQQRHHDG